MIWTTTNSAEIKEQVIEELFREDEVGRADITLPWIRAHHADELEYLGLIGWLYDITLPWIRAHHADELEDLGLIGWLHDIRDMAVSGKYQALIGLDISA
ncbi:unnamed protein product [Ascophyllum nodosum]